MRYHFVESEKRLTKPMLKIAGRTAVRLYRRPPGRMPFDWQPASWPRLKKDAVILAGGRLSNEDLFNLKQLADGLGGQALLYTSMGGGELTTAMGVAAGTNFSDMGPGTTILVVASDLYNEAPVWHLRIKQAAKRGATLIVVNARETKLERYAKFVVRYAYGDEVETVNGLARQPKIGEAISSCGKPGRPVRFGRPGAGWFVSPGGRLCRTGQGPRWQAKQWPDRRLAACQ